MNEFLMTAGRIGLGLAGIAVCLVAAKVLLGIMCVAMTAILIRCRMALQVMEYIRHRQQIRAIMLYNPKDCGQEVIAEIILKNIKDNGALKKSLLKEIKA